MMDKAQFTNDPTYAECRALYEVGELDCGFERGNFFNYDEDPSRIVIQYIYRDKMYEEIVDDFDTAWIRLYEIENMED